MPGIGTPKIAFRLSRQRTDQRVKTLAGLRRGVAHEHSKIRGDQFIPAASRMQFIAERAELFDQRLFDEGVHVFGCGSIQPLRFANGAFADGAERFQRLLRFRGAQRCRRARARAPRRPV